MSEENAVVVKDVYKSFRLPHEQHNGIKQIVLNIFKSPSKRKKGFETQHVLKDISFEIKKGEFFGIVGRNGSGKSTLLKLLAGIYTPDKGAIAVNGSLTPFIELGVGFNPELTGRENVFLNGALLGFSKSEMEAMYDDIVSFAELEKFMDQKLKNYSSGMQVRLAFSIAVRANSDILLIDEVLAVGDEAFQRKCFEYFGELKKSDRTIILVSHDMNSVRRFCDRALLLHDGKILFEGDTKEAAMKYLELNNSEVESDTPEDPRHTKSIHVTVEKKVVEWGDNIPVDVHLDRKHAKGEVIGVSLINTDGVYSSGVNSRGSLDLTDDRKKYICTIKTPGIGPGEYRVGVSLMTRKGEIVAYNLDGPLVRIVGGHPNKDGIAIVDAKWSVAKS